MFGFYMWILLNKLSVYNHIIKDFNNKIKHQPFHTYRLNREIAIKYNNYKIKNINYYTPIQNINQENNNNFYELQLDLKTAIPFIDEETDIINNYESPTSNTEDDYSTDSDNWSELSVD